MEGVATVPIYRQGNGGTAGSGSLLTVTQIGSGRVGIWTLAITQDQLPPETTTQSGGALPHGREHPCSMGQSAVAQPPPGCVALVKLLNLSGPSVSSF